MFCPHTADIAGGASLQQLCNDLVEIYVPSESLDSNDLDVGGGDDGDFHDKLGDSDEQDDRDMIARLGSFDWLAVVCTRSLHSSLHGWMNRFLLTVSSMSM